MSTQSQQGSVPHDSRAIDVDATRGPFLRRILALQVVFLLFLLIASIDEPTSDYNRAPVATQIAMVTAAWVLTDVATLALHAIRLRLRHSARGPSGRIAP